MDHDAYMYRAIELSKGGLGLTFPNPIVGAVLVSQFGEVIGEGFHAGGDHAEVAALKDCKTRGADPKGSTIYVSLEPCNHTGRTPPCTQSLLASGVSRVFYAVDDPNPLAQGGAEYLKSQGVEIVAHLRKNEAAEVNRAWLHKMARNRPYFIWKIASTFDGFTAASDGSSQWITSETSRTEAQQLRAESDAILIGTGTALSDNPALIPRGHTRRPCRVVVGVRSVPRDFKLYDDEAPTLFLNTRDIDTILGRLIEMNFNQVLVESGSILGTALLGAGLIDEITWYQAPTILGSGKPAIGELGIERLDDRFDFTIVSSRRVGSDLCSTLRPKKAEEGK